jgi:hypothetical protein
MKSLISSSVLNFTIQSNGLISREFILRNIFTFNQAAKFVSHLSYGRNKNKNDLITIFFDNCGTCSTKHALLKQLAIENDFEGLKLLLGLFKMNGRNTPAVTETLARNKLEFIPEAHNYLKFDTIILDFTKASSMPSDFMNDLIQEIEILPCQISGYKIEYHKRYLKGWLAENTQIDLSLDEIWKIREECIKDIEMDV